MKLKSKLVKVKIVKLLLQERNIKVLKLNPQQKCLF